MPDFDIEVNIRDVDGDLVLALEDEAGGYWIDDEGMPSEDRRWKGAELLSPWADGAADGLMTLDRTEVSIIVEVSGPNWASVETRHAALMDATTATSWVLEQVVQGVSKSRRAGPVDVINAPVSVADLHNNRRYVVLSFKVQPTVAISGI